MTNWGTVPSGSVLPFMFGSYAVADGASITLTGLAVTDVEIYKGTSMTQRSSDAGVVLLDTDGIDIDGTTGIHGFSIDTGDNTDAGFYAVGSFFSVVVASVTVDGETVNFVAGTFRLSAAEAIAGKPKVDVDALLGTAWLTPGTAGTPDVNAKLIGGTAQTGRDIGASVLLSSGTGAGQLDFTSGVVKANLAQILGTALTETAGLIAAAFKKFFNVATPTGTVNSIPDAVAGAAGGLFIAGSNAATTVNITGNITGNLVGTVSTLTTYTGNTPQTGDSFARLGAPAGASVSADLAAVKVDTAATLADTGTDGVVVAAASKTGYRLSSTGVDDIWDEVVDGAITGRQSMQVLNASQGGKLTGAATTTITIRDPGDSANRIVATVDADGNRSAVTLTFS